MEKKLLACTWHQGFVGQVKGKPAGFCQGFNRTMAFVLKTVAILAQLAVASSMAQGVFFCSSAWELDQTVLGLFPLLGMFCFYFILLYVFYLNAKLN